LEWNMHVAGLGTDDPNKFAMQNLDPSVFRTPQIDITFPTVLYGETVNNVTTPAEQDGTWGLLC